MKSTKIAVVAIVLLIGYMAVANPGNSGEPGHPMTSVLIGIQDAIWSLAEEPEKPKKEWYYRQFEIEPTHNDSLFVVPAGRQFVLLRLYSAPDTSHQTDWYLAANEVSILDGSINKYSFKAGAGIGYKFEHDFPDGCITVNTEETLNAVNNYPLGNLHIIVVGYFRDMPAP